MLYLFSHDTPSLLAKKLQNSSNTGSHFDAKRACPIRDMPSSCISTSSMFRAKPRNSRLTPDIPYAEKWSRACRGTSSLMPAWLYILRLKSGNLYIGSTTDLDKRYENHCSGRACRTTKYDSPVAIVLSEQLKTFSQARLRESQVKRWSRAKKEALVSGELSSLRNLSKSK